MFILDHIQFWKRYNGWDLSFQGFCSDGYRRCSDFNQSGISVIIYSSRAILVICHFWIFYYYFSRKIHNFFTNSSSLFFFFFIFFPFFWILRFLLDRNYKSGKILDNWKNYFFALFIYFFFSNPFQKAFNSLKLLVRV